MSTEQGEHWQNWSASVKSTPRTIVRPANLEELTGLVATYAKEGRRVRVVGAGHSFTRLVQTDDVLISLDNLKGIESVDTEHNLVTIWGGSKLHQLGDDLLAKGLAQ